MNRRYPNLRIEALRNLAVPAAAGAAVILLPNEANAASTTLPLTIHEGGANWYMRNSTSGNTSGQGLGLTEASLVGPPTRNDAYDGAFVMSVNGTLFQNPTGSVDLTGTTVTSGNVVMAGLTVSEQFYFDPASATVRMLCSYANPSGAAITVTVGWSQNLGSDSATTIVATSSGASVPSAADRWIISEPAPGSGQNDPVLTFIRFGPGATTLPTQTATPGAGSDRFADHYSLTVPAGQTRSLMFFGQLSQTTGGAEAAAATFNSNATLSSSSFLTGLTAQQESQIVNWNFGASGGGATPAPGTFVLLLCGLLVVAMVMKFLRWPLSSR